VYSLSEDDGVIIIFAFVAVGGDLYLGWFGGVGGYREGVVSFT
jgi:hypothetical protein